jgi:hypothetical protein
MSRSSSSHSSRASFPRNCLLARFDDGYASVNIGRDAALLLLLLLLLLLPPPPLPSLKTLRCV